MQITHHCKRRIMHRYSDFPGHYRFLLNFKISYHFDSILMILRRLRFAQTDSTALMLIWVKTSRFTCCPLLLQLVAIAITAATASGEVQRALGRMLLYDGVETKSWNRYYLVGAECLGGSDYSFFEGEQRWVTIQWKLIHSEKAKSFIIKKW